MDFYGKPNKSRASAPPISVYLISSDSQEMDQYSCSYCKRTIMDVKGTVDKVISTPMPVSDFDIAVNIRCKLCSQNYRILVQTHTF